MKNASTSRIQRSQPIVELIAFGLAVAWSVFQLFVATDLPLILPFDILNEAQQRPIHLAFALALAFLVSSQSEGRTWPVRFADWAFALLSVVACLYLVVYYKDVVANVGGRHSALEITISLVGLAILLEASRRFCGMGLTATAAVFIVYDFVGPYSPGVIAHAGTSVNRFADQLWLTNEGVFGITLAVSNELIFLFVLFGALLERAGAGRYFIQLTLSLVGHLQGGPGKACVVSSAFFGMISGSSLANLMTVGTFTIPLMKKAGFSAEKAGAIETCSSINGQLMPPVMGAAAFIMAEYLAIPYSQIVKHAFLPAVIAYVTLYWIVHVESAKMNIPVLPKARRKGPRQPIETSAAGALAICVIAVAIALAPAVLGSSISNVALHVGAVLLIPLYMFLLRIGYKYEERTLNEEQVLSTSGELVLPPIMPTLLSGLYYFIPVSILIWCLMVARLSAQTAVGWGIIATLVIVLTKPVGVALMRGERTLKNSVRAGIVDVVVAFAAGARNMIAVALALGTAGIIVGVVSQTGIGLAITELIEVLSGNNLAITLLLTAVVCVVLGMGLPTTANYIVVVALMATPITILGQRAGIDIPPVAVHLFVFYFGLLAGTTPPVAVDAFAAAAVAKSDPQRTALQAFIYDLRTSTLPFIFVFNPELLMIGVRSVFEFALVVATAVIGMIAFASALQNYFFTRNRLWEAAALLLVSFALLRPDFFVNLAIPPFRDIDEHAVLRAATENPEGTQFRIHLRGTNISSDVESRILLVPLGPEVQDGAARLTRATGIVFSSEKQPLTVAAVLPSGPAQKLGVQKGWEVTGIEVQNSQPNKHWVYLPALAIIAIVSIFQRRRRRLAQRAQWRVAAPT